jgi:hypothetical protein
MISIGEIGVDNYLVICAKISKNVINSVYSMPKDKFYGGLLAYQVCTMYPVKGKYYAFYYEVQAWMKKRFVLKSRLEYLWYMLHVEQVTEDEYLEAISENKRNN